jgi:ureidoglycolate lyase
LLNKTIAIAPRLLTATEFSAYGEVVSTANARKVLAVNDGRAQRFTRLATQHSLTTDLKQELSLYRLSPSSLPIEANYFERHPLTTQLFYPLCNARYLVLVCPTMADGMPDAAHAQAWLAEPGIGINYHAGVWHYPLVALDDGGDFLMLMAEGAGAQDCETAQLSITVRVNPLPAH